ncbi:MAG: alpha/beta-type small acid-soluble spore protein [Clostridia bacterium]|nr:alpha/beta-type small acid-soluble spore protein [Clostridia bacterium]
MYQNQQFGAQQNVNNQQNAGAQQNTQNQNGSRSNRTVVPEAKGALNQMKYEIASEIGINLKQGYNGDLPSRQAGYIGGYMVKRLVEQAERSMSGK